ncbi:hypothetical protein CHS0354_027869, partial [Potamilus streckersoni]
MHRLCNIPHKKNKKKQNTGRGTWHIFLTHKIEREGGITIYPTQQYHNNKEQYRPNRTAVHETWENTCRKIQNHAPPTLPKPKKNNNDNKTARKIQYAQDTQIPGPSKTHTLEELEEIRHAVEHFDFTHTNAQQLYDNTPDFEEIRILPKGKQPLRGPPKGKNSAHNTNPLPHHTPTPTHKCTLDLQQKSTNKWKSPNTLHHTPGKKQKTAEQNETDNNYSQQNRAPPGSQFVEKDNNNKSTNKTKDYHPNYLTLYLHYPITPNKQLSDSMIISELQKHKKGRIQIKHPKPSETTIRCFTGAQIRAYETIKNINGIPIKI